MYIFHVELIFVPLLKEYNNAETQEISHDEKLLACYLPQESRINLRSQQKRERDFICLRVIKEMHD